MNWGILFSSYITYTVYIDIILHIDPGRPGSLSVSKSSESSAQDCFPYNFIARRARTSGSRKSEGVEQELLVVLRLDGTLRKAEDPLNHGLKRLSLHELTDFGIQVSKNSPTTPSIASRLLLHLHHRRNSSSAKTTNGRLDQLAAAHDATEKAPERPERHGSRRLRPCRRSRAR